MIGDPGPAYSQSKPVERKGIGRLFQEMGRRVFQEEEAAFLPCGQKKRDELL